MGEKKTLKIKFKNIVFLFKSAFLFGFACKKKMNETSVNNKEKPSQRSKDKLINDFRPVFMVLYVLKFLEIIYTSSTLDFFFPFVPFPHFDISKVNHGIYV